MLEIIATINTKEISEKLLKEFYLSGVNVFRINMSHAKIADSDRVIRMIKSNSYDAKIMIDLPGPEIRIKGINADNNEKLLEVYFDKNYGLPYFTQVNIEEKIEENDMFYLQDGTLSGKVKQVTLQSVILDIEGNDCLRDNCHFNISGKRLYDKFLSVNDKKLLDYALENKVDYVALSFINSVDDIKEVQEYYQEKTVSSPVLVSKFETYSATKIIPQFIEASDIVYVARGDLGVEIGLENVPKLQNKIAIECNKIGKKWFVATQMLESMVNNITPTRAEVADIALAVSQNVAAVTLSDETTIGNHPLESIKWMKKIIDAN